MARQGDDLERTRNRVRLYVVHSQPLVIASLRIALESQPDIDLVGSQTDADRVEERVQQTGSTVVLLDESLDATRLTRIISRVGATARVIVLGEGRESERLLACMRAGATGYVDGRRGLTEIVAAIHLADDGWAVLTPRQVITLMAGSRTRPSDSQLAALCARLSERERDVLRSLAAGASLDETAARLAISSHTAQTHLKNAMRKLDVRSRLAAVVIGLRAGIFDAPT